MSAKPCTWGPFLKVFQNFTEYLENGEDFIERTHVPSVWWEYPCTMVAPWPRPTAQYPQFDEWVRLGGPGSEWGQIYKDQKCYRFMQRHYDITDWEDANFRKSRRTSSRPLAIPNRVAAVDPQRGNPTLLTCPRPKRPIWSVAAQRYFPTGRALLKVHGFAGTTEYRPPTTHSSLGIPSNTFGDLSYSVTPEVMLSVSQRREPGRTTHLARINISASTSESKYAARRSATCGDRIKTPTSRFRS